MSPPTAAAGRARRGPRGADTRQDFHVEDVLDRPFDRGLALRLLSWVRPYRGLVLGSLLLIGASTALSLVGPILVKEAIDGPLNPAPGIEPSPFVSRLLEHTSAAGADGAASLSSTGARRELLWWISGIYLALLLALFCVRRALNVVMNRTGQNVMRDLRVALFEKLQRQSLGFFQRQPVGRLVTRATSDVESLNELLTSGFVTFLGDMLTLAGIVAFMFHYDPVLAALALTVTPGLLAMTLVFRAKARKHYREIRRSLAHLNAYTQESIGGLEVIQISRREDARAHRYREINDNYMLAYLKSIFWYSIFFPSVEVFSAISLALVMQQSGSQFLAGTTTFGEFFLFWSYLNRFFIPIRDLAEKYNILQSAMASAERIFGILDDDTSTPEAAAPRPALPFQDSIRFQDVSFAYDESNPVLRSVSFAVRRGETVAIVGATGAGKSTVVNLLLRFHDPTHGRVLIDGVDLRDFRLAEHRRRFGLVLQDVAVFSRSVDENIDLDRGLPEAELRRAAADVNATRFIDRLAGGFGERMRERGRNLSSGERQLLAFARALAGDPEILVLDEATSHIDAETEALIQGALARLTRGRTALIIAHRLSTIRNADRILVFHLGELRAVGSPATLLARGGIYARLYRLQFGEPEPGSPA